MAYGGKKQGVISGSISWNNKEYVEIFDQNFKYLYGEVDDLFIAYGSWVEYDVVDSPQAHPKNCLKRAVNIDMDVKTSKAPTTDEFGKNLMNVRVFNKVDYFQYDAQGTGTLTHKTTIRRNYTNDSYYNDYYGEVILAKDSKRRLMDFNINTVDVMMNFISSSKYPGTGPHWEVTHFVNQGTPYSINGYLSIRGFVLRGPGGVVRNRRDVFIPPDSLRPKNTIRQSGRPMFEPPVRTAPQPDETPKGLGSNSTNTFGFGINDKNIEPTVTQAPRTTPKIGFVSDIGFGSNVIVGEKPLEATAKPPESPRGLASKGFGSFGGSSKKEIIAESVQPVQSTICGYGMGFEKTTNKVNKQYETRPKEKSSVAASVVVIPSERADGHVVPTSRQIGFGAQISRQPGMTFGLSKPIDVSSPRHPLDDSFESPQPSPPLPIQKNTITASTNSTGLKTNASTPTQNSFYDDWGDSLPAKPRLPTRGLNRSRLPPQVKTGLSKYSNGQF